MHHDLFRQNRTSSKLNTSAKPVETKRASDPRGWTLLGLYRKCASRELTAWDRDRLKKWAKEHGEEKVRHAIEEAARQGKVIPAYIEAILTGDSVKPGSAEEFKKQVEGMK